MADLVDMTTETPNPNGAGIFDFLSTQAEGAWDFATATVEQIGETVRAPVEALPNITLDTGDVPELPEVNLWPIAIAAALGLGFLVYKSK